MELGDEVQRLDQSDTVVHSELLSLLLMWSGADKLPQYIATCKYHPALKSRVLTVLQWSYGLIHPPSTAKIP
jgi:hypothetical protein